MVHIAIDYDKCKKDGMCVRVCPATIFSQREKLTTPDVYGTEYCISCGQCVAICRQQAISHSEFPFDKISAINFQRMPTADQLMELLKTRRSIRAFRDKPIETEILEKIIEGARFAPSGHNSQSTEFVVIQDRAILKAISSTVIEYLRFEIKRFANPFFKSFALLADRELAESGLHEIPGFKRVIQMFEAGADPILFEAPVLLAFHARRTVGFADVNAQLALQNASLVAHALGVGHFYTGWVVSTCRAPMAQAWNQRIPNLIGIPPQNRMHGALALGYPIPKFKNMIERKISQIKWL